MIEGIFGKKIGMTQIFSEEGAIVPVTVIQVGGAVTQRKVREKDGYDAVQVGIGEKKEKRTNKAMAGHFKKASTPCFYRLGEFRCSSEDALRPGQAIKGADVFKAGDFVDVLGRSKGKGFMGSMRRHHFSGGAESHGSMHNRAPGSIGSSSDPSRVYKGMRMAGHMGSAGVTVQNLKVVAVKGDENLILIRGAVPGPINGVVMIKRAMKKKAAPPAGVNA